MKVTSTGKITSSGTGLDGFRAAWESLRALFTVELPALLAWLGRLH